MGTNILLISVSSMEASAENIISIMLYFSINWEYKMIMIMNDVFFTYRCSRGAGRTTGTHWTL